ncbi:MAG: flagellar biosynthesis protein FlhF [Christensenellaceae bacterium]|jgi:flagellar biosynthesis protein FlhF
MRLKKFHADNMQEALRVIKEELGPDAVILSSKQVRSRSGFFGLFSKKILEVMAGYEEKPVVTEKKVVKEVVAQPKKDDKHEKALEKLVEELQDNQKSNDQKIESIDESIGELRNLISEVGSKIDTYSSVKVKPDVPFTGKILELYTKLTENDVETELAKELCGKAEEIANSRSAGVEEVMAQLMQDTIGKTNPIRSTKFKQKVVMLVGPTGVGKTTTLVKLASQLVVEQKLSVGIINTDVFRVAAQDQLKAYCDILNTEMLTIYNSEEIVDALDAFKTKDVVFLDTAGKVSDDEAYRNEIIELMRYGEIEDVYLTLAASTAGRVTAQILENYSFLKTHSIIVTKVDEVKTRGMILNIAEMANRPLSYITTGQGVPDDIAEINPREIVDSILEN